MTVRSHVTIAAIAGLTTILIIQARAGGDKGAFPANFDKGALYTTVDRPVITLVQYAAKLDAAGNPEKDANGRFIKTDKLLAYTVMEKRTGWGAEYAESQRNGEWEYQAFKADKTPNPAANLTACFNCHKPLDKQDFVFSYDKLKAAAK